MGRSESAIVYGQDDRLEFFETPDPALRARIAQSVVAIMAKRSLDDLQTGGAAQGGSLGERAALCPGEPFAEQPASALCTGVLLDWDLVLTAGHCVRVFAVEELALVFGYYYVDSGRLALGAGDVFEATDIVAEALDRDGARPRLDFAWLRLAEPVKPPRQPLAIRLEPAAPDERVTAVGAAAGVPLKVAQGGSVIDPGQPSYDYFRADTDTSHGASGGPALDAQLDLLGVLARGGLDYVETDDGCQETLRVDDGATAEEAFTYASQALAALCEADPHASSLCRPDCGDPCAALPPPPERAADCALIDGEAPAEGRALWLALLVVPCARIRGRLFRSRR